MTKRITESKLDRMVQAYVDESDRWFSHRAMDNSHYQIVRNDSKNNDLISDEQMTVYDLSQGFDFDDAEAALEMRQGRAAMHAALIAGSFL